MQTLLRGGTVVTCDPAARVFEGDVLVAEDGSIAWAEPSRDARRGGDGIAARPDTPTRVVDARGCAVVPGLVQAHVHLCQVLFRGMADDMPLLEWLKRRIWPLEAAHDERTLEASAELGLLEMTLAGTTTILDMGTVHHHDVVMEACVRSGIRAISGKTMMDNGEGVPAGLRESTAWSLAESERLEKSWTGQGAGRIGYAYAPRFILSCSEALVRGAAERSKAGTSLLHTHAAEHEGEREAVKAILGKDDLAILKEWGAFGEKTILAHGVQLTPDEMREIASDGTRIVHCPSANLKLGSGIAKVAELDAAGVKLALGADGAPCNNNLDPWVELRHAALLAKIKTGVTSLPAARAFRLATIDGARALGLAHKIGSIEAGKRADLVVVRLDGPHAVPGGDVYSKLVYACTARDVVHVFCDGKFVVRSGESVAFDRGRVVAQATELGPVIAARAGV